MRQIFYRCGKNPEFFIDQMPLLSGHKYATNVVLHLHYLVVKESRYCGGEEFQERPQLRK